MDMILRCILVAVISIVTSACGLEKKIGEMRLDVEVLGVFKAPPWAEGNVAPNALRLTIQDITFTAAPGGEYGDFVIAQNANLSLGVIDRPQIVFTGDLKPYRESEFIGAMLRINPEVTIFGKYLEETVTLSSDEIVLEERIFFARGKSLRLIVEVQWYRTIGRDDLDQSEEFFPPALELRQRTN